MNYNSKIDLMVGLIITLNVLLTKKVSHLCSVCVVNMHIIPVILPYALGSLAAIARKCLK